MAARQSERWYAELATAREFPNSRAHYTLGANMFVFRWLKRILSVSPACPTTDVWAESVVAGEYN